VLEPRWKTYLAKTAEPILTQKQCEELIHLGQNEPKIKATTGAARPVNKNKKLILLKDSSVSGTVDHTYRKTTISWIPIPKAPAIYRTIGQWMEVTNNNVFGFESMHISEEGQYAEYSEGGFYNWHMDSNVEMSAMPPVRKISLTLLLNDSKEFEGGELEIFDGGKLDANLAGTKYNLQQGYGVFFASFLLHRIKPIIKGNRKALVMWFSGPSLK